MYLRVAQGAIDPSRLDELLAVLREHGLPRMRQLPGLQHVYQSVDRASGSVCIVSTFDTQEHASFKNDPDFLARVQAVTGGQAAPPPLIYEVTDQI